MNILSRFPFSDKATTILFQDVIVDLKPFQIAVWVSISVGGASSSPFPAFLDTGHNETFSISAAQLQGWAGIDYTQLPLLPGVRIGKQLLPRCTASVLLQRNVPGKSSLSGKPPFSLLMPTGIIIQHPDYATRLPILGMRGIVESNLRLIVDGKQRHVSLNST